MCASTHLMLLSPASQYGKEKKERKKINNSGSSFCSLARIYTYDLKQDQLLQDTKQGRASEVFKKC